MNNNITREKRTHCDHNVRALMFFIQFLQSIVLLFKVKCYLAEKKTTTTTTQRNAILLLFHFSVRTRERKNNNFTNVLNEMLQDNFAYEIILNCIFLRNKTVVPFNYMIIVYVFFLAFSVTP